MHWLGHRLAVVVLPALILPLAAGCGDSSNGQFHAYQPTEKPAEVKSAAAEKQPGPQPPPTKINAVTQIDAPAPTGAKRDVKSPTLPAKGGPPVASSTSRRVEVLIPNKTFRPEGDPGALRVSYDDIDLLKVLNMDPVPPDAVTYFPAWLKSLDGRRIRIRGFMYPTFQQTGVHAFGLARDNQICCFGRDPKIYDVFDVVLHEGATTNYIPNRPFDVVGVFHIRPEVDGGKLNRLYEMDDATVLAK
jgi:hypothetical protein